MPQGLDATVVANGVNQGHVRRPLPVAKALDDALLAYEMNGEPLPPDHGFPVRLVVPGWIGVASIKWLGSIEVSDQPLFSPWNTTQYRMTGPTTRPTRRRSPTRSVKSAFELPLGATLPGRRAARAARAARGRATARSARVEVSTDGGATWTGAPAANLHRGWVRWEFAWTPTAAPGSYELLARATDGAGRTQPDAVPFNDGGYLFWAVVRHPVTVG